MKSWRFNVRCITTLWVGLLLIMVPIVGHTTTNGISDFNALLLKRVEQKYGKEAILRLQSLSKLVKTRIKADATDREKLEQVNNFFNQVPYYTDIVHWKKEDYWATPVEKLASWGGDCEDYAIAKYFTLRELGVKEQKLRIMYVRAIDWNEAHMVLTYFPKPNFAPMVLDNINPKILPATVRKDLTPVYSFNGNGLWLAKARGSGKKVGGSGKLSLWTDLMKRMDGSDL